jgi:hypothetical protein
MANEHLVCEQDLNDEMANELIIDETIIDEPKIDEKAENRNEHTRKKAVKIAKVSNDRTKVEDKEEFDKVKFPFEIVFVNRNEMSKIKSEPSETIKNNLGFLSNENFLQIENVPELELKANNLLLIIRFVQFTLKSQNKTIFEFFDLNDIYSDDKLNIFINCSRSITGNLNYQKTNVSNNPFRTSKNYNLSEIKHCIIKTAKTINDGIKGNSFLEWVEFLSDLNLSFFPTIKHFFTDLKINFSIFKYKNLINQNINTKNSYSLPAILNNMKEQELKTNRNKCCEYLTQNI